MEVFVVFAMFRRYMAILGTFSSKEKANSFIQQLSSLIQEEEYGTLAGLFDAHISPDANYNGKYLAQDISQHNMGALQVFEYTVDGEQVSQPKPEEYSGYFPKNISKPPKKGKEDKTSIVNTREPTVFARGQGLKENKTLKDTFNKYERIWKDNKEENE